MEWLRSSKRSTWRLFKDHPEITTRGRYYRLPEGAPCVPFATNFWSRSWVSDEDPGDELGEVAGARTRYDKGGFPGPTPPPGVFGSRACLEEGEPWPAEPLGLGLHGGVPVACWFFGPPPAPPPDQWGDGGAEGGGSAIPPVLAVPGAPGGGESGGSALLVPSAHLAGLGGAEGSGEAPPIYLLRFVGAGGAELGGPGAELVPSAHLTGRGGIEGGGEAVRVPSARLTGRGGAEGGGTAGLVESPDYLASGGAEGGGVIDTGVETDCCPLPIARTLYLTCTSPPAGMPVPAVLVWDPGAGFGAVWLSEPFTVAGHAVRWELECATTLWALGIVWDGAEQPAWTADGAVCAPFEVSWLDWVSHDSHMGDIGDVTVRDVV